MNQVMKNTLLLMVAGMRDCVVQASDLNLTGTVVGSAAVPCLASCAVSI